ncbi:uncharacterized protein TNCV_2399341 [Trichonephila clavipes]|uniref:Uncharacterized protein n=1 Tax=Trichonephila clavipes TaxID=2585209 RepID=A0A8X6VHE1_TRICX|nr:uncharacterized protein TNCV_2399341 [Trichonephila clavipes]
MKDSLLTSHFKAISYSRAFGEGSRNFEPRSSDEDDTRAGTPSPNYHTTPTGGRLSSDLTCIAPLHEKFIDAFIHFLKNSNSSLMLKNLRFDIFELQETKLPVRLINSTNERRVVQRHEAPLRVEGNIEDVSRELNNGG